MSTSLNSSSTVPKVLALVTARGGSKRLPGKNVRLLGGKPLIGWTIDLALEVQRFCSVLVSTDDREIAEVAQRHGALVPWRRPAELATDTATSVDVALHAVDWYESHYGRLDGVALLQPTSPFRTATTLHESLELFLSSGCKPVVSVTPALSHPAWCFRIDDNGLQPFLGWDAAAQRSQDLPQAYVTDGSIFILSPDTLRTKLSFLGEGAQPYVVKNPDETLDIDTLADWEIAAKIVASQKSC